MQTTIQHPHIDVTKPIVLIPAYNESKTIGVVISALAKLRAQGRIGYILVVNDGSKDKTAELALRKGADTVITLETNSGKAMGFFQGVKHYFDHIPSTQIASARLILLDGDLKGVSARQIEKLTAPLGMRTGGIRGKSSKEPFLEMTVGTVGVGNIDQNLSGQRGFRLISLRPLLTRPQLQRRLLGSNEYRRGYGLETFLNYYFTRRPDLHELKRLESRVGVETPSLRRAAIVPTKIRAGIGMHYKERPGRETIDHKRFLEEIWGAEIQFEDRNKLAQELASQRRKDLSKKGAKRVAVLRLRKQARVARLAHQKTLLHNQAPFPKVTLQHRRK